jgi:hypothetical protein
LIRFQVKARWMAALGLSTLQIASETWSFALGALTLLVPSLTGAYIARLRQRVLLFRAETDRQVRLGQLKIRAKAMDLMEQRIELTRLRLEIEQAEAARRDLPIAVSAKSEPQAAIAASEAAKKAA